MYSPVLLHGDFKPFKLRWGNDDRLLVLDWEFSYAGPGLMEIGELCRWGIVQPFRRSFETSYIKKWWVPAEELGTVVKLFRFGESRRIVVELHDEVATGVGLTHVY